LWISKNLTFSLLSHFSNLGVGCAIPNNAVLFRNDLNSFTLP
jgi:hypothetical protein